MKNNCFYYGALNGNGYKTLMCKPEFKNEKNYIIDCPSFGLKQMIFEFIKAELEAKNIPYTDLCISNGSGGIFCEKFKIIDSDYYKESEEYFRHFNIEIDKQNSIKNLLIEREKELLRVQRFITACRCVNDDVIRLTEKYINKEKINKFSSRIWRKLSGEMKGRIGTEKIRYLSCLTNEGAELNMEAFDIYCKKILVIKDKTGACARLITDRIRAYALGAGYDVISCPCTINEKNIEHIIIPELGFGIFTSKYYHHSEFENSKTIYAKRFLDKSIENIKTRTNFSLKAYRKLMNEVFVSLEKIKNYDTQIDKAFLEYNDINKIKNNLISLLL